MTQDHPHRDAAGSEFASNHSLGRREFLGGALALAGASMMAGLPALGAEAAPPPEKPFPISRKIKLGVLGNGGRGSWIAKLFQKHGGYEMHAVADYFAEVADKCGEELGVDKARRFSGLSAYKKLIESGVEAVAVETPPYFIPGHAQAAAEAGLHVYLAKPVAVDVPGALQVEAAGKTATDKKRVFLVDYQMPTEAHHIEIVKRIHAGALGKVAQIQTVGICNGFADPPKTATLESRLRHLVWVNDIALGCDYIGNFDIHAIDVGLWVANGRPVAASGSSGVFRKDPHGDGRDACSVVYEYADGLVHNHFGQGLKNNCDGILDCHVFGQSANAIISYWAKSFIRGGEGHTGAKSIVNLYQNGAERNIATFYQSIIESKTDNPTIRRSVDGVLACVLGREAAMRKIRLTMDDLLKENKRLEVDLKGLKA